ncbi:hypothetical protein [Sphingobacterium sp. LRF_L2]|uniref:hypothetical protein n=1 Tax=Sphingobacterium sp. LRF_L2 TaxID=3369421 RepID=UPI003F622EB8
MNNRPFDIRHKISTFLQELHFSLPKHKPLTAFAVCCVLLILSSCRKVEYTTLDDPAYLRVFNSLKYFHVQETKGDTVPYLCLLINPTLNSEGIPTGAEIVGDFLDVRDRYAPPYPSHIGVSTSVDNPEYPGKASVLVGPVLNGFDLSSWAQVPSGELRFMFCYRPKGVTTKFFDLPVRERRNILIDTTLNLKSGEVYTMNVLMKDFLKKNVGVLMREENFHKQAFSDSSVYVNFYNYSADNYWTSDITLKVPMGQEGEHLFVQGIRDTMNVFYTLMDNQEVEYNLAQDRVRLLRPGATSVDYLAKYMMTLYRDNKSTKVNTYHSFPMWIKKDDNRIYTDIWQRFFFLAPGNDLSQMNSFPITSNVSSKLTENGSNLAVINCLLNGPRIYTSLTNNLIYNTGINFPNMIVSTHSDVNNPQSFSTVNTIEVVNGEAYLMTIQRRYAPPVY